MATWNSDNHFLAQHKPKLVFANVVLHQDGEVLLVKPSYRDTWDLPGGWVETHESPWQAGVRECLEETGLETEIVRLAGVDSGYKDNGDPEIGFVFEARIVGGRLRPQEGEIDEARWVPLDEIANYLVEKRAIRCRWGVDSDAGAAWRTRPRSEDD